MQAADLDLDPARAVAQVGPAAAKLFVQLLLKAPGTETSDQFRKRCGIGDSRTYSKALAELRSCGLIEAETGKVWFRGIVTAMVDADGNVSAPPPTTWESLQCRMQEADEMPANGDKTVRASNFQRRRRAQLDILAAAWAELFPGDIDMTPRAAKALLVQTEDEGLDVLKEMERIRFIVDRKDSEGRSVRHPRVYLHTTLYRYNHPESDPTLRPKQPRPAPAHAAPQPAHGPAEDEVESASVVQPLRRTSEPTEETVAAWARGERPPPSPEMRAEWKRNGELLDKLGINWRE